MTRESRFLRGAETRAGVNDGGWRAMSSRLVPRHEGTRALALAAPLLVLLIVSFGIPIISLLSRAVYDPSISRALPRTAETLRQAATEDPPGDEVFAALEADLKEDQARGTVFEFAKSLNSRLSGARSQVLKTARMLASGTSPSRSELIDAIPFWGEKQTWSTIRGGVHGFTSFYLLSALDLRWGVNGSLDFVPAGEAVFLRVFARTFMVAALVTLATLALGFPLAYLISNLPLARANLVLVLVLLPFWTSILVRTAAWTVLLQKFGLLNDALIALGITSERLELMYSRLGLIIAMTHIQLPFTLLPIYSVMRSISPSQLRAAHSLGARPLTAFRRVYLPQALPGVMAGCLLTFILCLGYYITPALIGGASDQLISNFIANYVNVDLNWEMAAALSFMLLAFTLLLYAAFARFLGLDRFKLV